MIQTTLITAVLDWERRLQIEDEKRKAHRLEPYRELPTDFETAQMESESILTRLAKRGENHQVVGRCYPQTFCGEAQPG
ncbi:MAG: hypothetical protein H6667_10480 [Ardenticatenaceae bacterium]|nr:hypothetical protein [Ardenticatenaceae bacterium]